MLASAKDAGRPWEGRRVQVRRETVMRACRSRCIMRETFTAILACLAVTMVAAQPDPRQMSGIPRPDQNLGDGLITVRVIRGSFANNGTEQPVDLRDGDRVLTAETDAEGRAAFSDLRTGSRVIVETTVDGETLISQPFDVPATGGVAVLLVGGDGGVSGDPTATPTARPGRVTLGQDSRILVELGEENIEIYYLLDVLNVADAPVEPDMLFELVLPPGAQGATILQGSSPRTLVDGDRVLVTGGFSPGLTPVRVAYILPYSTGTIALSQTFPADFDQVLVFVEKWDTMNVTSPLIDRRGEMAADATGGSPLLWGAGGRVAAGQAVEFELTGLPHHGAWPRNTALSLALFIVAVSAWGSMGVDEHNPAVRRLESLRTRREKLFGDLVKVERQHRLGKIGATRYGTRRAELFDRLQTVLRDLDEGLAPSEMVAAASPREVVA